MGDIGTSPRRVEVTPETPPVRPLLRVIGTMIAGRVKDVVRNTGPRASAVTA